MGSIELRCKQAAHLIDYHMAVYLIVAISKYCFAGIFRSSCLKDINFMFLKTSECALSHGIWVVTLTYIVLCEQQAFLWGILFEILHIIMIVRHLYIWKCIIVHMQLFWCPRRIYTL